MKTPVLPLNEYINVLKKKLARVQANITTGPSPEDLKEKSALAVVGKKGNRVLALKEAMDIITEQAYTKGELDTLTNLLAEAEQTLKLYNEATSNDAPASN